MLILELKSIIVLQDFAKRFHRENFVVGDAFHSESAFSVYRFLIYETLLRNIDMKILFLQKFTLQNSLRVQ